MLWIFTEDACREALIFWSKCWPDPAPLWSWQMEPINSHWRRCDRFWRRCDRFCVWLPGTDFYALMKIIWVICCRIKVWYHVGVQVEKQAPSILLGVWICAIFSEDILAMTIQDVPFFELQANSGNLLGKQFVTVTNINLFNSYYLYYLSMCTIKNRLLVHSTSKSCPMYTQKAIQWN